MKNCELHTGILRPVKTNNIKEYMLSIMAENGTECYSTTFNDILTEFLSAYYKYYYYDEETEILYKIFDHDVYNLEKSNNDKFIVNEDGSISFLTIIDLYDRDFEDSLADGLKTINENNKVKLIQNIKTDIINCLETQDNSDKSVLYNKMYNDLINYIKSY